MKRNRKIEHLQLKYFVKSPMLYYFFLVTFVFVFLHLTLMIELDVRESYQAYIDNNLIRIESSNIKKHNDLIYIYQNKNDKIITTTIEDYYFDEEVTYFIISDNVSVFSGQVMVDISVGKQSLLEKIFIKAGAR